MIGVCVFGPCQEANVEGKSLQGAADHPGRRAACAFSIA
jgi:hypothetical protein